MQTIRFRDLSGWLKIAIFAGWVEAVIFIIYFIKGFIEGFIGVY